MNLPTGVSALLLLTFAAARPTIAQSLEGTLLIANQQSGSASVIDLARGEVTHLTVGRGPHETAISRDGRVGVVSIYGDQGVVGNQLALIDLAERSVLGLIDLGEYTRPHDVRFVPGRERTVAVTSEATGTVILVDLDEGSVAKVLETRASGSHMLGMTADASRLFTANIGAGSVSELDLTTGAFVREIPVAERTEGIAVTPDGAEVWVGSNVERTVSIVDTRAGRVAARLTGFEFPYRIAISANGGIAVVCDATVGRLHVFDVGTRERIRVIENLGAPRGVTVSADGRFGFVTVAQPGEVLVIDLETGRTIQRFPVGASPDGVAYAP